MFLFKYIFLLFSTFSIAQTNYFSNLQVGDVSALDSKLILQMNSTTKGSLIGPKMTSAQRLAILPPIPSATVVFDTDLNSYMAWDSTNLIWKAIGGGAASLSNWTPTTVYKTGDTVVVTSEANDVFRALVDHTSAATFNTDRLAGNWEKISPNYYKVFTPGTQYFAGDLIKTFDEQIFRARIDFIANADPVVDAANRDMEWRSPNDFTTAPLRGGDVTYAAPNYNVAAGSGIIVTNGGTPFSQINTIMWNAATITMPNPTGYNTIQVSNTGVVSAVSGISSALASKQNIVLAIVFAPTNEILPRGNAGVDHGNTMRTLSIMIGIVRNGVIFTGNANQTFLTTSGSLFFDGIGKGTETPNVKQCPAQPVTSFRLYDRDSDLGVTTTIPNAQYDVGGTLTAIPGTNWTYFKIYLAPNCNIILQYGQDTAPTKNEIIALQDVNIDSYIPNPQLQGIVKFVGIVYFQKANANFASNVTTQWVNSGLFGMGISGSGSSITATGDILGPAVSIDAHPMLFDGTTGKLAKDASGATFDPAGGLTLDGATAGLLITKPAGSLSLQTDRLIFNNVANTSSLSILPSPTQAGNITLTFPPNAPADTQILQTDAFGQLSWVPNGSLTNWVASSPYKLGQVVVSPLDNNDIFRALIAHTATASFTADRLAGNWEMVSPSHFIPFTPAKQYFTGDLIRTSDGAIYTANGNFIAAATPATDVAAGRMQFMSPADYTTSATSGGVVTYSAPNFAITAGTGFIVTNGGTPYSTITNVAWGATNIPTPLPNPTGYNTISVSSAGAVTASTGLDSPNSAKSSIVLATIFAPTNTVVPRNGATSDHGNTNRSLSLILGLLKDKIEFTGNNDNTFLTTAGSIYWDGIAPGTEQPNIKNCPVQTITNFNYYDQNSTISTNQTLLDTYNYDLNGTLTALPGATWSYSKIFLAPNCRVFVQHGQQYAATEAAIIAAEESSRNSYVTNPSLAVGVKFVGLVFFLAQTNNLSEGPNVTWINSGLFGIGVAGSGSTVTTNGDVFGPASSTDRAIAVFDGGSGKTLVETPPLIDTAGSISGVQSLQVKGVNTNTGLAPNSALNLQIGRGAATVAEPEGTLSANQTTADVAFEYGGSGGYRHYISTTHTGTTGSNNNSMSFWINNGAQALSADPGTGNVQALTLTPLGVGIGTQTPYRKFDVVGDIVTSVHGTGTQHDASELIGLRRIGHTSSTNLEFVGMGLTVKDVESDGVTARANNGHIAFYTWAVNLWGAKEVIRISERGRLGINTTNPTSLLHVNGDAQIGSQGPTVAPFNTGVARLTLTGANGNAVGPHQSWNTDSDVYPQRHFLNWTHDNIWDCWDCYYGPDGAGLNGNNIRGSTASSAFRWRKTATDLILESDPAPVAGAILAPVNRFYINENGPATFSNTVTAGPSTSRDVIGNGDLSRLAIEETKSFNPTVLANCNGWPGGCNANPLATHPTANGMYLSNANWSDTLYTPAVAAAGTAFYYQSGAQSTAGLRPDRTNLTGNLGIVNGWTYTFVSDGTVWNYGGQKLNSAFNAARVWPTSTTTIGFGTNGQVLKTNGAGSLSWGNDVLLMSAEMSSMKKTIADLLKRIKALEKK